MQVIVINEKASQPISSVKSEMPYQDKSDEESDGGGCNVSVIDDPKVSYFACDKFLNASACDAKQDS